MRAFCPDGHPITGTLEKLSGRANVDEGSFTRGPDGALGFEHVGNTEVFYDESITVQRRGQNVFLCEDGEEFPEKKLVLQP